MYGHICSVMMSGGTIASWIEKENIKAMNNWSREQRFVAAAFQNGLKNFQGEPLVLYGIGKNTQAILELTHGFSIVGLLDQDERNIGKKLYGKRVLSLDEAAAVSHKFVIVARATVTPIIYHRIKDYVRRHNIMVYDYAGKELETSEVYDAPSDLGYWDCSWEKLKTAIAEHEVISFDIFDTLVGRYVLQPRDVFALVERDLCRNGGSVPFLRLRVQAEQACGYAASIDEIYAYMCQAGVPIEDCVAWKAQELNWEEKLIFPRQRVVSAFQYALSLKKEVFLVSDMYLPRTEMEHILSSCGITGYTELLLSCEEKAEKSDGALFAKLLSQAEGKSILHIGDNRYSDIDAAEKAGLDTWQLYSSYELLMASSLRTLLADPLPELGDRLALGLLCAMLFEDPFALHQARGLVTLAEAKQVGYCFFGPWALSFMQWAEKQMKKHGIERFLLPSRDGFLFYHIGQIMQRHGYLTDVELRYIKASRRALIAASVRSEEDVWAAISGKGFRCTCGEVLMGWFRVMPESTDEGQYEYATGKEIIKKYLRPYLPKIYTEAQQEQKNLQIYLTHERLFSDKQTAVFDFAAAGSVQYYLERQLRKRMLGLYCARACTEDKKICFQPEPQILAAFGEISPYGSECGLSRTYMAIEALLVDGDRSLSHFDERGYPVFQPENGVSYEKALEVQKYACQFADKYLSMFGNETITLNLAAQFLDRLFSSSCKVKPPVLEAFEHDDKNEYADGQIEAIFNH